MAVSQRTVRQLSPVLRPGESLLYGGVAITGGTGALMEVFGDFLVLIVGAGIAGWVMRRLTKGKRWQPASRYRLAVTDRRLMVIPLGPLEGVKADKARSYGYGDISGVEVRRERVAATLRVNMTQGEDLQMTLPKVRNDLDSLEAALRDAAPQLLAG